MTAPVLFQALPPLSPEEYAALQSSIERSGIEYPIVVDEAGVVIDGHHRQKIAEHLGIDCPTSVRTGLDDTAKRNLALSLNIDRRHLTREQKRALVAASLKADPHLSDRQHAERVGVSHPTVAAIRAPLEATGQIYQSEVRVSADGRERPASQPARIVHDDEAVDTTPGEITTPTPPTTPGGAVTAPTLTRPTGGVVDRSREAVQQRRDAIREMAAQRCTSRQIGARLGINDFTVRAIAREIGVDIPADAATFGRRRVDSTQIAARSVQMIEDMLPTLSAADVSGMAPDEAAALSTSLAECVRALSRFNAKLRKVAQS